MTLQKNDEITSVDPHGVRETGKSQSFWRIQLLLKQLKKNDLFFGKKS